MRMLLVLLMLMTGCGAARGWRRLADLPDREGFAGSFAGVSNGALLVGGGANFPGEKPWEGGRKVWYDTVFVLERPEGQWKVAGRLPRPLGYGVSVTHRGGVVCVGGSDADRHHAEAFRMEWQAGELVIRELPPLPTSVANACGALVGDHLYIVGGLESPDATTTLRTVYRIELAGREPWWEEMPPLPGGGRMLAAAAAASGKLLVAGGVDLAVSAAGKLERRYLRDAFSFEPGEGWARVADLPHAVAAAPSPAPGDAAHVWILGGDDGSQVGTAPERHTGFSRRILRYDIERDAWTEAGTLPAAHVTAPCVRWNDRWVVASGEVRPGVRSPQVWAGTLQRRE